MQTHSKLRARATWAASLSKALRGIGLRLRPVPAMRFAHFSVLALTACLLQACGPEPGSAANGAGAGHADHTDHTDHTEHAAPAAGRDLHAEAGHAHTAPRGGLLVVLAEGLAHAELLLDAKAGRLDVHLLGPHTEMPMRCPQATLTIELETGTETLQLELAAIESALSGDSLGACSHYAVTDARLVGLQELRGVLADFAVLGRRLPAARFPAEDSK